MMLEVFIYSEDTVDFLSFEEAIIKAHIPMQFFVLGVLVMEGERALAKASLFRNPEIHLGNDNMGMIGCYHAEDHDTAVALLFDKLRDESRRLGMDCLIGPMDGSTWENYRFHDQADLPLFLMEMRHPAYYVDQWKSNGFDVIEKYYSSRTRQLDFDAREIDHIYRQLEDQSVTIRPIDLDNYGTELLRLHPFLLNAFVTNFLYSPISYSSFVNKYLPLKPYLQADFVLIAEHRGEIVGVFFCIQDFLDQDQKTLIIKTIARDPLPAYRGLGHIMAAQVYKSAREQGFTQIIHAFLKEEGTSTSISHRFFGTVFKTYSLYGKRI